jgi:membrane protease YdiL (CAAX protease family)
MQTLVLAHPKFDRLIALFEVLAILLLTILVGITLFDMGRHPLTSNLLHHLAFMLVPVLWLLLRGQALQVYGISLRNRRADWNAAMTAYLPLALGAAPLGFLDYRSWLGALVLSAVQIGVLFWVARRLSGKPDVRGGYWMLLISSLVLGGYSFWRGLFPGVGFALLAVFTYMSVGFGEEILYRGFMQTRLDQAFGRPYRFYGVSWGWGLILTSLIFGLTHTGILRLIFLPIVQGEVALSWPWGMWTFFGGLVFGWVRRKTGSIVAPAFLHGLPQAVAVALLGL